MKLIHCQEFHYMMNKHDHHYDSIIKKGSDCIRQRIKRYFFFISRCSCDQDMLSLCHILEAYLKSTEQKCSLKIIIKIRSKHHIFCFGYFFVLKNILSIIMLTQCRRRLKGIYCVVYLRCIMKE